MIERLTAALDEKAEVEAQLRAARERTEGAGLTVEALRQQLTATQKELEARERALADAAAELDARQAEVDELRRGAAIGDEARGGLTARSTALEAQLAAAKVRRPAGSCFACRCGRSAWGWELAFGSEGSAATCLVCIMLVSARPTLSMHVPTLCAAGRAGSKGCHAGGALGCTAGGRAGGRGQGAGSRGVGCCAQGWPGGLSLSDKWAAQARSIPFKYRL